MRCDPKIHHRRSIRLKGYDYTQAGAYFVTLVTDRREPIFGEVVNGEMKLSPLGQMVSNEWMRSIGIRKEIILHEDEFVVMPNHFHGIVWIAVGADGIRPDGIRPDGIRPDGIRPDGMRSEPIHLGDEPTEGEEGACHAPQPEAPRRVIGADPPYIESARCDRVGADGIRPDGIRPDGMRSEPIHLGDEPTEGEEGACHAPQPEAPQPEAPQPEAPQPEAPQPEAPQPEAPQSAGTTFRRKPKSLGAFMAGFKASVTSRAGREFNRTGIWQRNYYEHIIRNETEFKNIWNYIDNNPRLWERDQLSPQASPNLFNQE